MVIKTLLNKCYPVKGFIYVKVFSHETKITVKAKERKGSQGVCYRCKKVAKRLHRYQVLLLNNFSVKERLSNGIVEGFNLKAKLAMRKFFGFRTFKSIEVALYHTLGRLPEQSAGRT